MTSMLEWLAGSCIPFSIACDAKRIAVYWRYLFHARACRAGFRRFGDRYPQKVLFVAGLPKSGTTWLKRMLVSYPGFGDILIPEATAYELANGGSHDYDMPQDVFSRFRDMLVVTKMHVHGSPHNVALLREAGVRTVVLYRDLRDVAVSYCFYVRQTPWHPEYRVYAPLSVQEGLLAFAGRTLPAYVDWVRSWRDNRDPATSLILRYEQLLSDTSGAMARVAGFFELDSSPETIAAVVQQHTFRSLSGGRKPGEGSERSFFRKGVVGDWRNYFTPGIKDVYKRHIAAFLIEFGYERDGAW